MVFSNTCLHYKRLYITTKVSFIEVKMYSILLVLCMTSYSLSASSTLDGTCVNPTTLSFIENSLTNISDQLKGSSCSSDSATSEGLTGLLQLALVKELAKDYKDKSCDKKERKLLKSINASITNKIQSLQSQVSSLSSDLKNLSRLLVKHVHDLSSPLLSSCDAILSKWPNSPSGYYNLADVNGHTRHVYCHMETLCGKGGGWRRIASLNMTDPNEKCPTQFRTYSSGGVRACGRPDTNSGSCVGITFPSRDIKYSQVCGKVIGYQAGTTDGPYANRDINSAYIDGISLTLGNPRKHIWSLISGYSGVVLSNCPCGSANPRPVPSFVDSHYYCEAGCDVPTASYGTLYSSDPLWDGKGCGSGETTCCQRTLIPWFYRYFAHSTTDYIEMRVCCSQETSDEDVSFGQYEIYVK